MSQPPDNNTLPATLRGKKIVLVNHGDTLGEAAIATFRLMQALRREGVDARMVVYTRSSRESNVSGVGSRLSRGLRYCAERLHVMMHCGYAAEHMYAVSTGALAINVHTHPWVKEADIVCLSWINHGLMNLRGIRRLHEMGKKIIWTLHDLWAFTGICHQSYDCDYFTDSCGNCMFLKGGGSPDDLSHRMWQRKMELYSSIPVTFVTDSKWLEHKARSSSLLRNKPVLTIPNPVHVDYYYTTPPSHIDSLLTVSKPHLILLGANRLDDKSKGLDYAIEALNHIFDNYPEVATKTAVYMFGEMRNPETLDRLRMSHRWLGRINDQKILRYLYSSAKVILSTALLENLSDTIIEGMASGAVPVVFGGDSREELINHLGNGYVARFKDHLDIAKGVMWALDADISRNDQHSYVREHFSSQVVARKYIELFTQII